MSDVRDAIRSLRSTPAFTAVALLVLALGVGASTAVFSVVDAVALRSLPFPDADRILSVGTALKGQPATSVPPQDFTDWLATQDAFESLAASASVGGFTIRDGGTPEDLNVTRATASLFSVLRVGPRLGHVFSVANERTGDDHVAVISDALWRRRFNADPNVVGRIVALDNGSWQIVGVMPPGFAYPPSDLRATEMWVPYVVGPDEHVRGARFNAYLQVIGRLKAGVSLPDAQTRMERVTSAVASQYPGWWAQGRGVVLTPLFNTIVGTQVRSWMSMLLAAVLVVLLIACVNVANLQLVRGTARAGHLRIRAALGASRWRLARGLLIESLMLSLVGAALGIALSVWGVEVLRQTLPPRLPRAASIAVDVRVLLTAVVAAIVSGIASGVLPAWQWSSPQLANALREGGRSSTTGRGRHRVQATFVVVEVSLAVTLLVAAGLFTSSFATLANVGLGIDYQHVLALRVMPKVDTASPDGLAKALAAVQHLDETVVTRVRVVPGVEQAAAFSGGLPLSGSNYRTSVKVADHEFRGDDSTDVHRVTPDYLSVIGVPVLKGRGFSEADNRPGAELVAVINETAARRYFADHEPLGESIAFYNSSAVVVGVVKDVRVGGPEALVRPETYLPLAQTKPNSVYGAFVVVRTSGLPESMISSVKAAVSSAAPNFTIPEAQGLGEYFGRLVAQRKFNMYIVLLFGVLALTIASAGLYGLLAFTVEQRRQEIGVRVALGATRPEIMRLVLRRATGLIAAGVVVGVTASWWLSTLLVQFLFRVQPHDVRVYAVVIAVLAAAGWMAAIVPARRASATDPLVALREG